MRKVSIIGLVLIVALAASCVTVFADCDYSYIGNYRWVLYYKDSCGGDVWKKFDKVEFRYGQLKIYDSVGNHIGYWECNSPSYTFDFFDEFQGSFDLIRYSYIGEADGLGEMVGGCPGAIKYVDFCLVRAEAI